MAYLYIGLGTNLGNKIENLNNAIQLITKKIGTVCSLSSYYNTSPWGFSSQNNFLNAAACIETTQTPHTILQLTQNIEQELGRTSKSKNKIYHDRPIDIDLLIYDQVIIQTPDLQLPHPLMHLRHFVMEPLVEIAPTLMHPVLQKTILQLFWECCKHN